MSCTLPCDLNVIRARRDRMGLEFLVWFGTDLGGEGETDRVVRVGGNMTNYDNELPVAITNRKQIDIIIHILYEWMIIKKIF